MKKISLLIVLAFFSLSIFAQSDNNDNQIKTLVGNKNVRNGVYLGTTFGYSQINNEDALYFGGKVMWIMNHAMGIGLGGGGFASDSYIQYYDGTSPGIAVSGGYGGLYLEPIIFPKFPVHVSFPILLGAGGIGTTANGTYVTTGEQAFFIVEPSAEIELNVVKFMRVAVGGTYRLTTGISLPEVEKNPIDGFTGNITLKFGWF